MVKKLKETVSMLMGGNETFCLLPTGFGKSSIFDQNCVPLLNITMHPKFQTFEFLPKNQIITLKKNKKFNSLVYVPTNL